MTYPQQNQGANTSGSSAYSGTQIPPSGWPPGYGPSPSIEMQSGSNSFRSYSTTPQVSVGYLIPQTSTGSTSAHTVPTSSNFFPNTPTLSGTSNTLTAGYSTTTSTTLPQYQTVPTQYPTLSSYPTSSTTPTPQYTAPTSSLVVPPPPPTTTTTPVLPSSTVPVSSVAVPNVGRQTLNATYAQPIEEGIPVGHTLNPPTQGHVQEGQQLAYDRDREWLRQYGSAAPDEMFLLREWFSSVDQDRSGEINATELQTALGAGGEKFNDETCKMLIQMFDADQSQSVNFVEFAHLYKFIRSMRDSFDKCDIHRTGFLNATQLGHALTLAGFVGIPPPVVQCFFKKFDRNRRGKLSFENYMELCVVLGFTRIWFRARDTDNDGKIIISINDLFDIISRT